MITNNNNVVKILEKPVLDYDVKEITFLSSQEVVNAKELKLTSEGSIYVSNAVMLELVIRGNYKDTEKEKINFTRKIRHVDVDNNAIQTIDYGTFVIMNAEYDNGSETTTLLCYDLMVQTQREYVKEDITVTFPNTVRNVLSSVVQASGLELDTNTFNNENVVVDVDYWVNASYTYRDVLDHIAQLTTSTIKIKNGKVHVFDIEDTGVTLKDNFVNLKLGEQYGKTNILNISQEPQHDNFFSPENAMETIPVDDRKELVFSNNPILYDKAQHWADTLLPLVSDLEYTTAEFKTYQGGIFEVGDKVKVYAKSTDSYHDVIITKQVYTNTNVQVELVSSKPFSFKSEYVVETDQKREGQTTYFIVDKQNGIIEGLVNKVDEVEEETSRLAIEVGKISTEVENIHLGNMLPNANGKDGLKFWLGNGDTLYVSEDMRYVEGITYGTVALPVNVPGSASEFGMSYYNKGEMISEFMRVIPTENTYSFRSKVSNFKPIKVKVLEYETKEPETTIFVNDKTNMEQGGLIFANGNPVSTTTYCRTKNFIETYSNVIEFNSNGTEYNYVLFEYNSDKSYIKQGVMVNGSYRLNDNTKFVKIRIGKSAGGTLNVNNVIENYFRLEDENSQLIEPIKETTYNLNSPMQYVTFTHTNQEATNFMKLTIEVPTATINSMTTLTETMFNAREPKEWFESANDVAMYSKSLFEQLSDKMVLMVNSEGKIVQAELGVNPDTGAYFVVNADNISLNGYTEINGKFRVNKDGTVYMQDAFVEGTINAVRGEIGNFEIEDGVLKYTSPYREYDFDQSDMAYITDIHTNNKTPTPFELYLYDLNNDGVINASDMMIIKRYLLDLGEKPIRIIASIVEIGTNEGSVRTTIKSNTGLYGNSTVIKNDKIDSPLVNTNAIGTNQISLNGQEVYIDSNNFLKVR